MRTALASPASELQAEQRSVTDLCQSRIHYHRDRSVCMRQQRVVQSCIPICLSCARSTVGYCADTDRAYWPWLGRASFEEWAKPPICQLHELIVGRHICAKEGDSGNVHISQSATRSRGLEPNSDVNGTKLCSVTLRSALTVPTISTVQSGSAEASGRFTTTLTPSAASTKACAKCEAKYVGTGCSW